MGHCLSMRRWAPSIGLKNVDFKMVQFWVQVHELGLEKFSEENAKKKGNNKGKFIAIEEKVENTGRC